MRTDGLPELDGKPTTAPLAEFVERLLRTTDPEMTVGEFVDQLDEWLADGFLVRGPDDPGGTYRMAP